MFDKIQYAEVKITPKRKHPIVFNFLIIFAKNRLYHIAKKHSTPNHIITHLHS
jgi:hypothetical protein